MYDRRLQTVEIRKSGYHPKGNVESKGPRKVPVWDRLVLEKCKQVAPSTVFENNSQRSSNDAETMNDVGMTERVHDQQFPHEFRILLRISRSLRVELFEGDIKKGRHFRK